MSHRVWLFQVFFRVKFSYPEEGNNSTWKISHSWSYYSFQTRDKWILFCLAYDSCFQAGMTLPPRGYLVMSETLLIVTQWGEVCLWYLVGELLSAVTFYSAQDSSPQQGITSPKCLLRNPSLRGILRLYSAFIGDLLVLNRL